MKRRGERGITLIEVAVVMSIVAIMGLFMAPALGEWIDNYRIRQSARDISSILQQAKMKAISSRLDYRVCFDLINEAYVLEKDDAGWHQEGDAFRVPRGVNIDNTDFTNDSVQFNPNGTILLPAGSIYINNAEGKQYRVNVSPAGAVSIREGWS